MDEEKRFLVIYREDNSMQIRTASEVSNDVDMQDCYGPVDIFYLTDEGKLEPVTVGSVDRWGLNLEDNPHAMIYGGSDLICKGEVVGAVYYTDH